MGRMLLIEDSLDCQVLVRSALQGLGTLCIAKTLQEARALLEKDSFDLLVVDVNLPDGNGFQFCSHFLMDKGPAHPRIFFLTGQSEVTDKLLGFSIGADDYLVKPFEPLELRARVIALQRKTQEAAQVAQSLTVGNLRLYPSTQKAEILGVEDAHFLDFTPTEFKLLHFLAKQEDHIFSREQLLNAVNEGRTHVLDRTIDSHLSRTRKKLLGCSHNVESVYGLGYRFCKAA